MLCWRSHGHSLPKPLMSSDSQPIFCLLLTSPSGPRLVCVSKEQKPTQMNSSKERLIGRTVKGLLRPKVRTQSWPLKRLHLGTEWRSETKKTNLFLSLFPKPPSDPSLLFPAHWLSL